MGGSIGFLLANDRESLMWFANMGCIEIHPFHSRVGSLEHPDLAIFDLDPAAGSTWDQVIAGARLLRVALGAARDSPAIQSCREPGVSTSICRSSPSIRTRGCGLSSRRWGG